MIEYIVKLYLVQLVRRTKSRSPKGSQASLLVGNIIGDIKCICVKSGLATPNALTCAAICHRRPNLDDDGGGGGSYV